MTALRVLVVDDEAAIREQVREFLLGRGFDVEVAAGVRAAEALLGGAAFDVAILDLRMPDGDGLGLAKVVRQRAPQAVVLMMTAYGNVESAVEAMRSGVQDYLVKPVNPTALLGKLELVDQKLRAERELLALRQSLGSAEVEIIGASAALGRVRQRITDAARHEEPVLIVGETGTGKELVARALHRASRRKDGPFVVVDCGALPEQLAESELFGHVRGAFTGAAQARSGRIASASGGTVFLDELGAASEAVQSRLLRVLETHQLTPVGSDEPRQVDVRVIAATNVDPEQAIRRGELRPDLYYRVNTWRIDVPPLRERRDDIVTLVEHFLKRAAAQLERGVPHLGPGVLAALAAQSWPGNVRQLRNMVVAAVAVAGPSLEIGDLPAGLAVPMTSAAARGDGASLELRAAMEEAERHHLIRVLSATGGVMRRAAEVLGIDERSLRRKVRKYGIDRHAPTSEAGSHESSDVESDETDRGGQS